MAGRCGYLREKHSLLVSIPPHVPQNPNAIPHARLRTQESRHTVLQAMAEGMSRAGGVLNAVLTVEQGDRQQGAVVLWGAALTWLQCIRINRNKSEVRTNSVWEFRVLLVRERMTSGLLELYSTPWGSCAKHSSTSLELDLNNTLVPEVHWELTVSFKYHHL